MKVAEISPDDSRLSQVYEVMRELRPHLSLDEFEQLYRDAHPQGYRVAAVLDGDEARAVAGYRIATNLVSKRHMYVDDLVTAERWRSQGYGRRLNEYLVQKAQEDGCESIQLDSAVHRGDAHRFYFREHYRVTAFHFGRYFGEAQPAPTAPRDHR
jgi:ribosomal protein S18 acetylase RimI-like enzyme